MTEEEDTETSDLDLVQVTIPSWPDIAGVPLEHRARAWCLATAMEIVQNPGGRPAVDTAKDAIAAAAMIQDWILDSKVPPKPRIVGKETP